MTENTKAATETTSELDKIRNRPMLMSSLLVDDGCDRIQISVREGDEMAAWFAVHVESVEDEETGDESEVETEATTYLNSDELFEIGLGVADALAALGQREELANLIGELVQTLAKMKN